MAHALKTIILETQEAGLYHKITGLHKRSV